MAQPRVLVLTGYGINCDEETAFAFETAGAKSEIVHVNDLIEGIRLLRDYQILAIPGGFSFGDDTGSGNALAARMRHNLEDSIRRFIEEGNLGIGICNGFQVMVNFGFFPAIGRTYGVQTVALTHNDSARYLDRWVDLHFHKGRIWTQGVGDISLPIAHGEGKLSTAPRILEAMRLNGQIAAKYFGGEICSYQRLPANPNGSLDDIAGITDESGRFFGLMPHPERALFFTQLPHWPLLKERFKREGKPIPAEGPGRQVFRNGVQYFR